MKAIIRSWDSECGCPVESIKKEIRKIQRKHRIPANEGYLTTFTNDYEMTFMVFSTDWITQEEAKQYVKELMKGA